MIQLNPFTPKSGVEPKIFVDREKEIELFIEKINQACEGNINHFIVNGDWGAGKTILLKYFKLIAQERNIATSYFLAREFIESAPDIEIVLHIVQSIIRNIPVKINIPKSRFFKRITGFGVQIFGTGFNLTLQMPKERYTDPQILLSESLLGISEDLKRKYKLLTVLIDDAQNYKHVQRIFTTLKNVLSEDRILKGSKILFVLSSTIEGWKNFIQVNNPIGRFFIPRIELENLDLKDTIGLIGKTLQSTGVIFSENVKRKVYKYTEGHLFKIHVLCNTLYENHNSGKVSEREWGKAYLEGLLYLGTTVYDGIATNISKKEIEIIKNIPDIFATFKIKHFENIKIKGIREYFSRLVKKGVLAQVKYGEYKVNDILLAEYIRKVLQ